MYLINFFYKIGWKWPRKRSLLIEKKKKKKKKKNSASKLLPLLSPIFASEWVIMKFNFAAGIFHPFATTTPRHHVCAIQTVPDGHSCNTSRISPGAAWPVLSSWLASVSGSAAPAAWCACRGTGPASSASPRTASSGGGSRGPAHLQTNISIKVTYEEGRKKTFYLQL